MSDKSNSLKQPQGSLGKTIRNYKLELGMTVILIVLYIVLHAVTGTALGKGNVMNVLQSAAPLLIMTMGQLLVVITGGIDLSVGSVYSLSGMVGALVMLSTGSIAAGVAACLAVGLVCGVLNGLLVAKAKMAPFIVTLAMQGAAASLTKVISGGNSQTITLTAFKEFNRGTIIPGLKNYILYMIIIVVVMYFVLRKTSFGRWVYATGSNEGASHLVGIPVDRVKILCYTISAGLSSIAALLGASRLMTVECTAGVGMELDAIAATCIGGASLSGGLGSAFGALIGTLLQKGINNGINLLGINSFWSGNVISYEQIPEYVEKADYAVISTPPTKRLDYVEMVLSKHVPLYLEKPIATTLEDAEKIVAMAKQYDAKIIVGFAHRFRPAFVKMYDMVKSGMFGDPVNVFSYRVGAGFGYGKNNAMYGNSWRTDPKLACGMTIESVSHEFNLLTSLAGEFDTIACNVKGTISNVPQFDTNSTMVMRCKNGAVASIMTSWSSGAGANLKGYIGTNGSILLRGRNMFEFDSLTYKTVDMDHEESITFNDSYDLNKDEVIYHVHVYFQDCLKNNKPVEIGGLSEGMKVLKLSNAALESAKEQKTIALGDYYTL